MFLIVLSGNLVLNLCHYFAAGIGHLTLIVLLRFSLFDRCRYFAAGEWLLLLNLPFGLALFYFGHY